MRLVFFLNILFLNIFRITFGLPNVTKLENDNIQVILYFIS